jgi:hypothetical protein
VLACANLGEYEQQIILSTSGIRASDLLHFCGIFVTRNTGAAVAQLIPWDRSAEPDRQRREKERANIEDVCGKSSIIKHTAQGSMFEHIVPCISEVENISCSSKVIMLTSISLAKGTFYQMLFRSSLHLNV